MLAYFFQVIFLAFVLAAKSRTAPTEAKLPTNNPDLQIFLRSIQVAEPQRFVLTYALDDETASFIELTKGKFINHGVLADMAQLYEIVGAGAN